MTKTYFEELMQEFNCHVVGSMAFGAAEEYPYSAELLQPGDSPEILVRFMVDGPARKSLAAVKKKGEYVRWYAEHSGSEGVLVAVAAPPSDFYAKATIYTLLKTATQILREAGLQPPAACPLCGQGQCDSYAYLEDGYRQTHAQCLETRLDLPEDDEAPKKKVKGYYFTGIIGALLGAFVGAIPIWSQALSRGRVFSVMYALIPILSMLVYRLCRGKARRTPAEISVLLASLLVAFLLELFWFWLVQTSTVGYTVSMAQTTVLYFETHTFLSSVREMLVGLICLAVGCIPAAFIARKYADTGEEQPYIKRGARLVRASAMPMQTEKGDLRDELSE